MKILLVTVQFVPDFWGGTEVLTYDTAKMLQKSGNDVIVLTAYPNVTPIEDKDRFDTYMYDGLEVYRFRHSVTAMGDQNDIIELEYNNLFFANYFKKLLLKIRPDVVHFFHLYRTTPSAIDVCTELNIPIIFTATDFWVLCPFSQLRDFDNSPCTGPCFKAWNCARHQALVNQPQEIKKKVERLPKLIIALGVIFICMNKYINVWFAPYIRSLSKRPGFMKVRLNRINKVLAPTKLMGKMLKKHGLHKSRIVYQHFGIDMHKFDSINFQRDNHDELRVGFIGTLYVHKGAHLLIDAIKKIPQQIPVHLKIYGDIEQFPEYSQSLIHQAAGESRIEFCGTFPNNQIGLIMKEIDVLAVPSIWYENTPLVIYSAFASGCPVIATNFGGMTEVIQHGVNGLLFEREDVAGLSNAIISVAENRNLLMKLSSNVQKPKSMEKYVAELEKHYQDCISR